MKLFKVHIINKYHQITRFVQVVCLAVLLTASSSYAGIPTLNLLSLDNFVIVAGSTITGIPPITITGNVGLSPAAGSYITGFDGSNVIGSLYVVDASGPTGSVVDASYLTTVKGDLTTAYTDAANRTPVPTGTYLNPGAGNIGGMNLPEGLYKFTGAADITGADVTLTGSATDVWIFQIATSLNLGSGIKVILAGGAQAANVFWQVGTSATLGTYSVFKGTILADQSITLGTGASMDGRALAFEAAVTMASGVTSTRAFLAPVFSADPLQLAFGNVSNDSSKTDTITVTNTGGADLIISNVTSSNTLFTVTPTTGTITPGSSQQFYVTFSPIADSARSANIIFTHNAVVPQDTIPVTGTGVSPVFSANLANLSFGDVRSGTTKLDSITVTNTGTADLIITSVTSSNSVFTVTPTSGTIAPDSSMKFYVTFTPSVDGIRSGNIIFNHNAQIPNDTVTATGTGVSPFFSANTSALNFGNVRNGTTKMDSVTVTNTGTSDLNISGITSSNTLFAITPMEGTIAPGATKKFYVTFAPLVDGLQSGNIIFNHNAQIPQDTITVTGTGVSPLFSATPSTLNFGNVRNGTIKIDSVTVTNTGTADLIISSVTSSNTLFTITPTAETITPGASQKYYITFAPLIDGVQTGNIVFNHNALLPNDTIRVTGTGVSPMFSATPTNLNFGNVRNGTTKIDSVTVSNTGTSDLIITSIVSSNPVFTTTPTNGTIAPGATQKFYITFAPLVDGLQNGTITFNHNAAVPTNIITVSGTGVSPMFSATPTNLNFGNVRNGTTKRDSVTVTNTGTSDLIITSVVSSNSVFTTTPVNGTIAPGATQKFYITFAPLVDGLQNGTVTFNHNASVPTNIITVSGTGVSPMFSATPTNLNFGNVRNGTTKRDSVTVTNTGTSDLIITSVTSSNPLFTVTPTIGTIAPGATQKFYITFAPIVDGVQNGNITFNHNGAIPTNVVTVSGTGVSPMFSANPTNLNFGNVRNGTVKMDSVTITNTGTFDLVISNVTSSNPLFAVTPTTGTIAPGATQKFYITFAPIVDGVQTGNITFNHNGAIPTNVVTVSGTGVSPQFTANPTNLNFGNVRNGTTKIDSVTITNTGTFDLVITNVTSSNPLFTVTPTTGTIAPGATQKFYITFAPLVDGVQNGTITFNHNGAIPTNTITVSGTGVSPAFSASTALNFGNVRIGTSKTDFITVTNLGTTDLIISNATIVNRYFTISPTSGVIAPGASQKFFVTFSPIVDGLQSDYVYFNHNSGSMTDLVAISGNGVSPKFYVNPTSLNFGSVRIGTRKTDSVMVANIGTDNLTISSITSSNGLFTVSPLNGTLIPGESRRFYITFSPIVNGVQNGIISFNHDAVNGTDIVTVTGNGDSIDMAPSFSTDVANLDFGDVFIGSTKQKSVIVTNRGMAALIISGVTSTETRYSITPLTGTLAPGASKEFFITFAPIIVGRVNASIVFTHNEGSNSIGVTGNGIDTIRIITIKAARDLPIGTLFITEGIVTRSLGSFTRIQDSTGGLTLFQESGVFFDAVKFSDTQMGDKVQIQGRISEKDHLKVVSGSDLIRLDRLSRMNTLPTPKRVTLAEIASNGELYESCLIRIENLTITTDGDVLYHEAKIYQTTDITDKTNTVVIRIGNAADTYMDGMLINGTSAIFEGVLSQSGACASCGYQLTPVLSTDLSTQPNGVSEGNTSQLSLSDNYPNPFNTSTSIQYSIPSGDFVSLKVFNTAGQVVSTLVNSFQIAGTYTVQFSVENNAQHLSSEMYFYRLEVGKSVSAKQMILVK